MVYIPAIFFLTLCAYFLLAWSYSIKDFAIMILASFMLFGVAIFTATQGVEELNNFVTVIFSSVNFGIAAYFSLKGAYDYLIVKNY